LDRIHVPKTPEAIAQAGREITAAGVVGFDTESKPTFQVGERTRGPHLIQFALRDRAFLFQLDHHPECHALLAELLHSEQVLKVGFGLRNDRGQIRSRLGVNLRGILDLDHIFRQRGYKGQIGVRAAVGAILQQSFRKSKRLTTSNWAAPNLAPKQLLYAANDAYAALRVMEALDMKPGRPSPKYTLRQGKISAHLSELAYHPSEGFQESNTWHVSEEAITAHSDRKLADGPATIHCGSADFPVTITLMDSAHSIEIACAEGLPKLALALGLLDHLTPKQRQAVMGS
jgi:ribonuclease D